MSMIIKAKLDHRYLTCMLHHLISTLECLHDELTHSKNHAMIFCRISRVHIYFDHILLFVKIVTLMIIRQYKNRLFRSRRELLFMGFLQTQGKETWIFINRILSVAFENNGIWRKIFDGKNEFRQNLQWLPFQSKSIQIQSFLNV